MLNAKKTPTIHHKLKQTKTHNKKVFFENIPRWAIFVVLFFTALLYSKALFNDFVNIDDDTYLFTNPYVTNFSWNGIKDIFSVFFNGNYHPLTTISFLFEYTFYGLNPFPYHLLNIVLHLLNTWLVFKFVETLSNKRTTAFVVAILFAVHPMHVESVAWISERKDVLYTFFYLLSLWVYMQYLQSGFKIKYYWGALFLFGFALLSKSAAVTLPVLLIAIDLYNGRKFDKKALLEKISFFVLSLFLGVMALLSQGVTERTNGLYLSYTIIEKVFLYSYSIAFYIIKAVVPFNLSAEHYFPDTHGGALPWEYYASLPFLLFVIWLITRKSSFRKEIIFGAAFFLITLSVMIYVPVGFTLTAERYSYVPYLGLFYIAGQWISLAGKIQIKKTGIATLLILIILFSWQTYERIGVWKNGIVLFTDVINKNPTVFHGYKVRGDTKSNNGDYQEALKDYNKVMECKPGFVVGFQRRGYIRNKLNDFKGALEDLNAAISIDSTNAESYMNRGIANDVLGNTAQALTDYNNAVRLDPQFAKAFDNRGVLKAKSGDLLGAMKDINTALSLNPNDAETYSNRGNLKAIQKDYTGSIEDFSHSLKLNPNNGMNYFNRGLTLLNLKDTIGACEDWKRAEKLGHAPATQLIIQYCH
ncbi:MAG: tetratricopeptide repeat protein [Bacteroidetes bacterium]|nr:tetratricopeptide repeat protein [Bacteroidota bacterium]